MSKAWFNNFPFSITYLNQYIPRSSSEKVIAAVIFYNYFQQNYNTKVKVLNRAYAHKESNFQGSCSSILFEKFTSLTPLCTWNMNEAKVSQNIYVRLRWTGLLRQWLILNQKGAKNIATFLEKHLNSQRIMPILFVCIFGYIIIHCAFAFCTFQ